MVMRGIGRIFGGRKAKKNEAARRQYISLETEEAVVNAFHKLYFESRKFGGTWKDTYWLGTKVQKVPFDLWIYQEILYQLRPDVIVETGTADGGSALFMATICDVLGTGRIITVDVWEREGRPVHPRITYLGGSSIAPEIVGRVRDLIGDKEKVMVVLDSDHSKAHVSEELKIYHNMVSKGQYMIIEDTNVNGNPIAPDFGPGPMEAVEEFLKDNHSFEIDRSREKFYLTFSPKGYLKRIR
jgi:cephalosporin hydroxylase